MLRAFPRAELRLPDDLSSPDRGFAECRFALDPAHSIGLPPPPALFSEPQQEQRGSGELATAFGRGCRVNAWHTASTHNRRLAGLEIDVLKGDLPAIERLARLI
jgi:hypothetical protein